MNKAYLLIGGNEGDRINHLNQAMGDIEKSCGKISRHSSIYETAPWGILDQPSFLNRALLLLTSQEAIALINSLLMIEEKLGRIRREKYGPRTIDIDILFFNREIINKPGLQVPHPELQNRRFALEPLNEIAPDFEHPVLKKKVSQLLKECRDPLNVKKI